MSRRLPPASALRLLAAVLFLAASLPLAAGPARGEALSDLTFRMLREVKRLRGLEPKTTVGVGRLSPEALRALIHRRITEEYTPRQLKALQRLLALTGLIPADYDLINRYVELLVSQALGFYDFKSETFFLSTAVDPDLHAAVVLHELTHALQDQHFQIYRRLKALKDQEDARTALQALIEGEATALMLGFSLENFKRRFYTMPTEELLSYVGGQEDLFKDEPPVMRDFLYFPYEAGLPFIRAVRRRRPWGDVDVLYRSPPVSTEQVLHPERLLVTPDPPRSVRWPEALPALGRRWRRLDANTLGELGAYLLVKPFAGEDVAAREAAAGWGGDRYLLLEEKGSGRAVALLAFVWDTERDAEEFADAYRRAASSRAPEGSMKPGPAARGWVARRPQGLSYVERRAERVLILEGVPPEALEGFRDLGWSAQVAPPPAEGPPPTEGLARRELYRRRAESYWRRGDLKEAAKAARRAVDTSVEDTEALYLLGAVLALEEATLAEGIDFLTHAVNREPSLGPAQLEMGRILEGLELREGARLHLARAHAIMPDHLGAATSYAALLLEGGEVEAAEEVLAPWSSGRTEDPETLALLGRIALARGKPDAARRHLTASLGRAPSSAVHLALGALEAKEGNLQAAEEHLRRASDLDPEGAAALAALGDHYRDQGVPAEAERRYREAASRDPNDPVPSTSLGRLALAAGDRKTAEVWFTHALASDPRWRPALEGLRTVLSKEGRPVGRLEALLARPLVLETTARRAIRAGRRCLEQGLLKRARQQFEVAVRLDREHPGAWVGLGMVHEREDRLELAKVAYLKTLDSPDPLPPSVQDMLLRWVVERRPAEASAPVLKRFLNATDDGERQRAALALGALGDRRVVPLLIGRLESQSPPVQAALAEALGHLEDPAAAEPLERLGATSRDPDVRSAVQRALARLRGRLSR